MFFMHIINYHSFLQMWMNRNSQVDVFGLVRWMCLSLLGGWV